MRFFHHTPTLRTNLCPLGKVITPVDNALPREPARKAEYLEWRKKWRDLRKRLVR